MLGLGGLGGRIFFLDNARLFGFSGLFGLFGLSSFSGFFCLKRASFHSPRETSVQMQLSHLVPGNGYTADGVIGLLGHSSLSDRGNDIVTEWL
jgi:hypothetical protein